MQLQPRPFLFWWALSILAGMGTWAIADRRPAVVVAMEQQRAGKLPASGPCTQVGDRVLITLEGSSLNYPGYVVQVGGSSGLVVTLKPLPKVGQEIPPQAAPAQ